MVVVRYIRQMASTSVCAFQFVFSFFKHRSRVAHNEFAELRYLIYFGVENRRRQTYHSGT